MRSRKQAIKMGLVKLPVPRPVKEMEFIGKNWEQLLPTGKSYRITDSDTPGLACKVSPKGEHKWVVRHSPEKYHQVEEIIGPCEVITIIEARKEALRIANGIPRKIAIYKRPTKSGPKSGPKSAAPAPPAPKVLTFKEAIDNFMVIYPHKSDAEKRNKGVNFKRILNAWGSLPVNPGLTEKMVLDFLDDILIEPTKGGKPKKSTYNSVLRTLKRFYKWGRVRYGLGPTPCTDIEFMGIRGRKERLYYPDLELLGAALMRSEHQYRWGVIVPLLCGGRIGSLENIEQGRYDSVKRRYEFQDVEGTKDLDYLYISPHTQWCLDQLPRISPALIRTAWEQIREDAKFDRLIWRHDFRRTFRSLGSDIEEDHIKLECLIGHSLGTLGEIYHHNDWKVLGEVNDRVCLKLWESMKLPKLI